MNDTQRAEIEEELHALTSLIDAVGWGYFKRELEAQATGFATLVGPPATVDDFTILGLLTHAGNLMASFPDRLVARRENLLTILEAVEGDEDA